MRACGSDLGRDRGDQERRVGLGGKALTTEAVRGSRKASQPDDRCRTVRDTARRRTGGRAPCAGLPRPRRRAHLLRALRRRPGDDPVPAALGDQPLALLEGAGAVSLPPLQRPDLRPARQRPLRPAGVAGRVRGGGHGRGRARAARRARPGPRLPRRALRQRRQGAAADRTPSGALRRRRLHVAGTPDHAAAAGAGDVLHRAAPDRRRLGEAEPPLLAARLSRLPGVLLRTLLHGAALHEADRGRHRLGARDDTGHARAHREAARIRRGDLARADVPRPLPRARDPGRRGRPHSRRPRRRLRGCDRRQARHDGRRRAQPARARPGPVQPAPLRLRECVLGPPAGATDLASRGHPVEAGALHLVTDRPRPRLARPRDRAGAPPASARADDRLARAGSRHARPRSRGRADPSRQPAPGERVAPHRGGVRRPPAARVRGDPADGRDPARQLHGLPRSRPLPAVRPLDRRRGLGARLLPAREPRAEDRSVLLADGLRRLAADARSRRARGHADRGLQRRDDRADRALPARPRPGDLHRRAGGRRPGLVRPGPAADPRLGRRAVRVQRLRDAGRRSARSGRGPRRARLRRGRAGVHRGRRRLRRRRRPAPAGAGRATRGRRRGFRRSA